MKKITTLKKSLTAGVLGLAVAGSIVAGSTMAVQAEEVYGEGLLPTDENIYQEHLVQTYRMGDVNKDNKVSIEDASDILRYALKIKFPYTNQQSFLADANGNGTVTLDDAVMVLKNALGMEDVQSIQSIADANGNATAFVEETDMAKVNNMTILTSKEELEQYVANYKEENAKEALEKYAEIFQKQNLLAVRVQVNTEALSDVQYHTVIHGNHIFTKIVKDEENVTDKRYELMMFLCIDKKFTNDTAKMTLDSGNVSRWKEVSIETTNAAMCVMMNDFNLRRMADETDYVFSGTIVDRHEYEIDWLDDSGEQWGPYSKSVLEVKINKDYYGECPVDGDIIRIYYPYSLSATFEDSILLDEQKEYVFITYALDDEFVDSKAGTDDKHEHEKHADVYITDPRYGVMAVEDEQVIMYKGYFSWKEDVMAKRLPINSLPTDRVTSEDLYEHVFIGLKKQDFEPAFMDLLENPEDLPFPTGNVSE